MADAQPQANGVLILHGLNEVLDYLEQFKPARMEHFARFVLSKGYGAKTPKGETWQTCGRRLFGAQFIPVMDRVLNEHRLAAAGTHEKSRPPSAEIDTPEPVAVKQTDNTASPSESADIPDPEF